MVTHYRKKTNIFNLIIKNIKKIQEKKSNRETLLFVNTFKSLFDNDFRKYL